MGTSGTVALRPVLFACWCTLRCRCGWCRSGRWAVVRSHAAWLPAGPVASGPAGPSVLGGVVVGGLPDLLSTRARGRFTWADGSAHPLDLTLRPWAPSIRGYPYIGGVRACTADPVSLCERQAGPAGRPGLVVPVVREYPLVSAETR